MIITLLTQCMFFINYDLFLLVKPSTQPNSIDEPPKKINPSLMSLDGSKKIPPMLLIIIPIPIKYSGFSFFILYLFFPKNEVKQLV